MIKVYLASGWFNPAQVKQMEEIYNVLESMEGLGDIALFAPFWDGIVLKKDDPELRKKMKEVWDLDIRELSSSDLVVASTQDHDVGTIFECGYASAKGIPILCYNSNEELGLNLMLAQEARGFCKTEVDLGEAIKSFIETEKSCCPGWAKATWQWNLFQGDPPPILKDR